MTDTQSYLNNEDESNEEPENLWYDISQKALSINSDEERSTILNITVPKLKKNDIVAFYRQAFDLSWSNSNIKLLKEIESFKNLNRNIDLNEFSQIVIDSLVGKYDNVFQKYNKNEGNIAFHKEMEHFNIDYVKELDNSNWSANAQHCHSLLEVILFNNYNASLDYNSNNDRYFSDVLRYVLDKKILDEKELAAPLLDRCALFVSRNLSQLLFSSVHKNSPPKHSDNYVNESIFELFELLNNLVKKGANIEKESSIGRAMITSKKEDGTKVSSIGNVNKSAQKLLLPVYCWLLMSEDNKFKKKALSLDVFNEIKKEAHNLSPKEVSRVFLFYFTVESKKGKAILKKNNNIKNALQEFSPNGTKNKDDEFWSFSWFSHPAQIYIVNDPESAVFAKKTIDKNNTQDTTSPSLTKPPSNMKFVGTELSESFKSLFESTDFSSWTQLQIKQFFNQSADKVWNFNFKNIFCSYQSIDISARANSLKAATTYLQNSMFEQLQFIADNLSTICPEIKQDCQQIKDTISSVFETTFYSKEKTTFQQKLKLCDEQVSLYIKTNEVMILNDKNRQCVKKIKKI